MIHQRHHDELIQAAWNVIESDFDQRAFLRWRKQALDFLTFMVGPDHQYTLLFRDYVKQAETLSVLAGKGVLVAAREQNSTEKPAQPKAREVESDLH
ncbi:MAG: hypothetical protein FJ118_19320 [Deltaproteobacteria bacterium]|nr:hypothetical protein [Deltaproteobacteria bacterium]